MIKLDPWCWICDRSPYRPHREHQPQPYPLTPKMKAKVK